MNNDAITSLQIPEDSTRDVLAEILRDGTRKILGEGTEVEVADYIAAHALERDAASHRRCGRVDLAHGGGLRSHPGAEGAGDKFRVKHVAADLRVGRIGRESGGRRHRIVEGISCQRSAFCTCSSVLNGRPHSGQRSFDPLRSYPQI